MRAAVKQALQCAQWCARWVGVERWVFDHVFNVPHLGRGVSPLEAVLTGRSRTGTRSDGREQGRNGADGCSEDRAKSHAPRMVTAVVPGRLVTDRQTSGQSDRPAPPA